MQKHKSTKRAVIVALEEAIEAGLATLLPKATIPINGQAWKSTELQAQLRAHILAVKTVKDIKAQLYQAVATERKLRAALTPRISGIRTHVAAVFGELSAELRLFGFDPRKTRQISALAKAHAIEKRKHGDSATVIVTTARNGANSNGA